MVMMKQEPFRLLSEMHIHLVGIGGSGISAIARVLVEQGYTVSGSDMQDSDFANELRGLGVIVSIGHAAEQILGASALVISSAIPADNVEVTAAREQAIPVMKRAEFLGALLRDKIGIAIAGTHGKTTTTSMVAQILLDGGFDPSVIVGGVLPSIGTNARAGDGEFFVIEADEYDYMFLGLNPEVAVINNLEHDHPDMFPDDAAYIDAFYQFALTLPDSGRLVVNADDVMTRELLARLDDPVEIYQVGLGKRAQLRAEQIRPNALGGTDCVVTEDEDLVGLLRLRVPGEHNVRNALMAIAVTLDLGIEFSVIRDSLMKFGGVGRRFEEVGSVGDVVVIDDYAHHPTEIRMTLAAAKQRYPGRTVWAVWQPHTYSRTKLYFDEFTESFTDADRVIVLDIYRSRERDTLGIDSAQVVAAMNENGHPSAHYVGENEQAAVYLLDRVAPGDVVLTMGAGDGNAVGLSVIAGLKKRMGVQ